MYTQAIVHLRLSEKKFWKMTMRTLITMIKMNRRLNDEKAFRFAHVMHTGKLPPGSDDDEEEDDTDAEEDQWSLHF